MKKIVFFSFFISLFSFGQTMTQSDFDSKKMNETLVRVFNDFRKSMNLDTLIYSKSLHDTISFINCMEVANSGEFYHPDITKRWKKIGVKNMIAMESKELFNDSIVTPSDGIPQITYWENGFRFRPKSVNDYKTIAELAIKSWELSPSHQKTQNLSFLSKGLSGFFSCHSTFADNGYIYIFINFVQVNRF